MRGLARWCIAHRGRIVVAWLVAAILATIKANYRATGEVAWLDLLRDTTHNLGQYLARPEAPVDATNSPSSPPPNPSRPRIDTGATGGLSVRDKLEIGHTAVIRGKVSARTIAIAKGAIVDGEIEVTSGAPVLQFEEKRDE